MIVTILFFLVCFWCGWALVRKVRLSFSPLLEVLASLVLGVAGVSTVLFLLAWMVPFSALSVTTELVLLVLVSGAAIVRTKSAKSDMSYRKKTTYVLRSVVALTFREKWAVGFLVVLVVWLFGRALFYGKDGQLWAGDRLVWTDWPVHMAMSANFAYGANFPPQNPTFAGLPLIYPFFADFVSGVLLALDVSLPVAFAMPGIVMTLSFFGLFLAVAGHLLVESKLLKTLKSLKLVVMGALFLSLFWGGLGFVYWLQEAFANELHLVETILAPAREYTFWGEKGLWFFTFLYSEILPQRAFLFGLPLFFLVLLLVYEGWQKRQVRNFVVAGVVAGLMPFFHSHSYMSLVILSVTMAGMGGIRLLRPNMTDRSYKKKYFEAVFLFFVPFGALSLFQLPLFLPQSQGLPFEFGWLKGKENFFLFWFKNTGFFIPLYLLGLWKGRFGGFGKLVGVSTWILFLLPNLFRFAPWGYDNLKIFTYWYLIGSMFVVTGLVWIGRIRLLRPIGPLCAGLLFISLTLSGLVEVGRLVNTSVARVGLWAKEDQEFAQEIRQKTPPSAVFLTAAVHDHPVASLAGRKILLGFPGNSWSWGIKGWDERERDIHTMFRGSDEAKNLWKKYGVDYIVVGDKERWFDKELDEVYIAQNSVLFFRKRKYKSLQSPILDLYGS